VTTDAPAPVTAAPATRGAGSGPPPGGAPPAGRRRRRPVVRVVAATALVGLVVLAVLLATRPPYQATAVDGPLVGKMAPALTGTDVNGRPASLASYRGRYVYVNFFANWCVPCQEEEPNLVQFAYQQTRRADGAAVLGVVFESYDAQARAWDRSEGATWPAVADPGGAIANRYGVTAPPTTFLVDPGGRIVGEFLAPVTVGQLNSMLADARADALGGTGG
jgi:cytochrome c biogenesis protein CcmG/thiol:disulfide interchange protein DsbE